MAASTLRSRAPLLSTISPLSPSTTTTTTDHPSSSSSSSDTSDDEVFYGTYPKTFTPAPYTMREILAAIPAHCFERSALRSFSYVVADFAMLGAIAYAASFIDTSFGDAGTVVRGRAGLALKWAAWSAYWIVAGWNFTGIWICGQWARSFTCRKARVCRVGPGADSSTWCVVGLTDCSA